MRDHNDGPAGITGSATAPVGTASAFADWVFERNNPRPFRQFSVNELGERKRRRDLGIAAHRQISDCFRYAKALTHSTERDWDVVFVDQQRAMQEVFYASKLMVNGEPLKCLPDVVLRHKRKSEVVVIERKTTYRSDPEIPRDAWPNVQAQLWCYSWIDDWLHANNVIMVAQVWRRFRGGFVLCQPHPSWRRSDEDFNRRCLAWFRSYGGTFAK